MKCLTACMAILIATSAHAQTAQPANATPASGDEYPRFTRDTTEDLSINVVTDRQTGCRYLLADSRGITPLLKASGVPDCTGPHRP